VIFLPVAAALLSLLSSQGPQFESKLRQLAADREEAFNLCAAVRGHFGYTAMVSLGNDNLTPVYFPAGRADRMFLFAGRDASKRYVIAFEVHNGTAKRLWESSGWPDLKEGRLVVSAAARRRASAVMKADLAQRWSLAMYTSENMGSQKFGTFVPQTGKESNLEMLPRGEFDILSAERAWLAKHGLPAYPPIFESAIEQGRWQRVANRLAAERKSLLEASRPFVSGQVDIYVFPIGKSDRIFIFTKAKNHRYDAYGFQPGSPKPHMRWHIRLTEDGPAVKRGYLAGYTPGHNASRAMKEDLGRPLAAVWYSTSRYPEGSPDIIDEFGEYHWGAYADSGKSAISTSEMYMLKANRDVYRVGIPHQSRANSGAIVD
jgi:hypothetical protein